MTGRRRREEFLRRKAESNEARKERNAKKNDTRKMRLKDAHYREEERINRILAKRKKRNDWVKESAALRSRQEKMRVAKNNLRNDDKWENIERMKRIAEFVRLQTLQKIEEENARTQRLKDQREGLVQARRQNSLNALLRKHKIQEHVEQMRISKRWDKLNEINRILEEDPMKASKKGRRGMRGSQSLPQLESP